VNERAHGGASGRREAERVRRAVAAFEPHLVRAIAVLEPDTELPVELEPAARLRAHHHHRTRYAVGVELPVPGAVERVGEVDAFPVAADLDHLRPAAERPSAR